MTKSLKTTVKDLSSPLAMAIKLQGYSQLIGLSGVEVTHIMESDMYRIKHRGVSVFAADVNDTVRQLNSIARVWNKDC